MTEELTVEWLGEFLRQEARCFSKEKKNAGVRYFHGSLNRENENV
jgi:hypothetical protein